MEFKAKMILDSISPAGKRLTTVELTYPRFIHSEVLTHRDRARNSASSRAIPWPKMMERVLKSPVVPIRFGSEQKGMQTGGEIDEPTRAWAIWMHARDDAIKHAQKLADLGVHKSICNRLTEPFMWITVIMTATEWNNFFRLRCHPDAEIHFQKIAGMCKDVLRASCPTQPLRLFDEESLNPVMWHLPLVSGVDLDELTKNMQLRQIKRISVARCARVSYLTHDGVRDPKEDLRLFDTLSQGSGFGHWSPMEHVATPCDGRSGPFVGWKQFRKDFANENLEG